MIDFLNNHLTFNSKINKDILFLGITRDSATYIESSILNLRKIGNMFNGYDILIYENDSTDNTLEILDKNKINYLSEKLNLEKYSGDNPPPTLLQNMAYYRAKIREEALKQKFDYYCIVDFDIVKVNWDGFFDCFNYNIDIMCANSQIFTKVGEYNLCLYYDYFAHRDIGQIEANQQLSIRYAASFAESPFNGVLNVDSAFGGMTIYSREAFESGQYDLNTEVCEHVPFHKSIRDAGFKIQLNKFFTIFHGEKTVV